MGAVPIWDGDDMASAFNIPELEKLLRNFYRIAKIRIVVFDENFEEITAYPRRLPTFCTVIRTAEAGRENCLRCDKAACLYVSERRQQVYTYQCHAGLKESIVPIVLDKAVIGYLIFGHIAPCEDIESGWEIIREHCRDYPIDMGLLESAFADRRYFSDDYIDSAAQIMKVIASYVCISHMAVLKRDSLPLQIDRYLQSHLEADLDCAALCERFELSRTKLYQLSLENFGTGITDYIRDLRLKKARELLETTNMPVREVAARVGIGDYNYFTKLFKNVTGLTPRDYRKSFEA